MLIQASADGFAWFSMSLVFGLRQDARRDRTWIAQVPAAGFNLGYRLDDSSSGTAAHHLYADYQIFSKRGVLWFQVEQRFRDGADRTILALNGVF